MYHAAIAYAQNGDLDKAMLCLNKTYAGHGTDLLSVKVDPGLDPPHSDPRFQDLIRRIGLPQDRHFLDC
jgi:hypothetical protein